MVSTKAQAIPGAGLDGEPVLIVRYPSVSSGWVGQIIGRLSESISWPKINGIKPSYLLIGPLAAPVALLGYVLLKIFGCRYVLTNRSLQTWQALGPRMFAQVSLADIDQIAVEQMPGQEFYKAADLNVLDAGGKTIMRLEGIVRPEVFKQNILESRDSQREVESSLATINARQPA